MPMRVHRCLRAPGNRPYGADDAAWLRTAPGKRSDGQ
jgi:hypothetical protein